MPVLQSPHPDVTALRGLHVYHALMSNCSMRVRLLLEEKGLSWTSHEIDLGAQENLEEWYLRINPKGLVPAIVHDGVPVTESNDILHYLEARFPKPALLPEDPAKRQEVRSWVDRASDLHIKAMKTYMYGAIGVSTKRPEDMAHYREIQPDASLVEFHQKTIAGFDKEEVQEAIELNHQVMGQIEAQLDAHRWLGSDSYSLADIAWYPNTVLLKKLNFPLKQYPKVVEWMQRNKARPSYASAIGRGLPKLPLWAMKGAMKVSRLFRR